MQRSKLIMGRADAGAGKHEKSAPAHMHWAVATSHKASSRNVSCVRIHQGSPLSSAADDMEAGRLSS